MLAKSILPIILIFHWCISNTFGQIQFRNFQTQDGLSQNSVVSITQDKMGNLWFATQDGLNKYNGEFEIFEGQFDDITRKNHLTLGKLYTDNLDNLWKIEKSGTLAVKKDKQFNIVPIFGKVTGIIQDHENNYWIANQQNILFKANDSLQILDSIQLECKSIYTIQTHPLSGVLIANNTGLYHIGSELNINKIHKDEPISDIFVSGDNIFYSLFGNEILLRSVHESESQRLEIDLNNEVIIYSILVDQKGLLWIGTYGHGLYVYDMNTKDLEHYIPIKSNPFSFSYHDVLDIFEDKLGIIWIGTDGGGISYYDQNLQKFNLASNLTLPEEINVDVVRAIYSDKDYMSLGISGKGLTRFDKRNKQWKSYQKSDGLFSDRIMSIIDDGHQGLWIGSQFNGLTHLKFENNLIQRQEEFLDSMTIWCISNNFSPYLFLGTENNGLIQFNIDDKSFVSMYPELESMKGFSIRSLTWASPKKLIIGTDEHGVFVYDVMERLFDRVGEQVLPKKVKHVHAFNKKLYVSTNGYGLFIWNLQNDSLVAHYDKKSGLVNNVIYGVIPTEDGDLWLSSNRGISRLNISNIDSPEIKNFGLSMGLQSLEFNTGAHFRDTEGNIYLGGINGVNWFHPDEMPQNQYPPKVDLLSINVKNKSFEYSNNPIELPHNKNSIKFHVTSMSHTLPEETEYSFRLNGFEKEWKNSKSTYFEYMNVPAGDYIFECKAKNYDGVESIEVLQQEITIRQAWYLSNWFKIIMMCLLIFALWQIRQSEMKAIKHRNENELEKERNEQLKEVEEIRKKFFANISHEIKTPLTIINGLINKLEGNTQIKSVLKRNSKNLLELIEQLLKVNKLESNRHDIQKDTFEIFGFLQIIIDGFSSLAKDKNIVLNFEATNEERYVSLDKNKMKHIIENLLSNAIKYTPINGMVDLSTSIQNNELQIIIKDTGIGIEKQNQKAIFDRYFQVQAEASSKDELMFGVGVGLSIVKDFIHVMSGSIEVQSELGKGSKFIIMVPFDSTISEPISLDSSIDNKDEPITILLVDDNKDLIFYYQKTLKVKYKTITAYDGDQGIRVAEKTIPDLIITDIMMPNTDGITLIKKIKNNQTTNHIPIIVLSAKNSRSSKLESLSVGADAIMQKPFDEQELLIRIESLLLNRQKQQKYFQLTEKIVSPIQNLFIQSVKNIINQNISNPDFGIKNICDHINLERSQLYRKVKSITGYSPNELITKARMAKAKELLLSDKSLPVREIAMKVGYFDVSYFSRVFKKYFNQTAKQFRDTETK